MDSALAIGAALVASLVTAIGIRTARRHDDKAPRWTPRVVALAAGVLVTAALVHLLPHALRETSAAPFWALVGFLVMVLLHRVAMGHVCEGGEAARRRSAAVVLLGIALHSFLDGLTYTVAFSSGQVSGLTVALGMILHELPEGLISFGLLAHGGMSPARAAKGAWLAAGATTPLGALLAVPVLDSLTAGLQATLVAACGGVLLYVGAAHLLPQVERDRAPWAMAALALGVGIALASGLASHGR